MDSKVTSADPREILARAICREMDCDPDFILDGAPMWRGWQLGAADAAIEHLANAGFKIVPREPTLAMRKACTFEVAERDYPAMWDAA